MSRRYIAPLVALAVIAVIVNLVLIAGGVPAPVIGVPTLLLVLVVVAGNWWWYNYGRKRAAEE
jgi:hypothetical protein